LVHLKEHKVDWECSRTQGNCTELCDSYGYSHSGCYIGNIIEFCTCTQCEHNSCLKSCQKEGLIGKCTTTANDGTDSCGCFQ